MNYLIPYLNLFLFFSILSLGIFVYLKKRDRVSLSFLGICIFGFLWTLGVMAYAMPFVISGKMGLKVAFTGASFLLAAILYFIQVFPKENYFPKPLNFLLMGSLILIGILSIPTGLMVSSVSYIQGVIVERHYGPFYPAYAFLVFASLSSSIIFSIIKYRKVEGVIKKQAQYVLLGLFTSFILVFSTNLLFPLFNIGSFYISQYGPSCLIFFFVFSVLAITRYHLFDIKLILTELLVSIIAMVSLFEALLFQTTWARLLGFSVFILFGCLGYLLIKSTKREINAKENLEQKVNERTKELRESKDELEKFYRLTIGREVRMAELKEKIKEMEDKTKNSNQL